VIQRSLSIIEQVWPLQNPFIISRGGRMETRTVTVLLEQDDVVGRGECVPYGRYGETIASVTAQVEQLGERLEAGLSRTQLQRIMPAGAARNAIDAALWDLEAKSTGRDVGQLSGLAWPSNISTVQTISILTPEEMGKKARALDHYPLLKVKLDAEQIIERVAAVHANAPKSKLLVDANESWTIDILNRVAAQLPQYGVRMIEQPLHADADESLADHDGLLPIFADESCHIRSDLDGLKGKYDGINIKLDKSGGLTEALALADAAKAQNYEIMLGCMLGTSLGIAPAMFLADRAKYVDLDPPSLVAKDREYPVHINKGRIATLSPSLWGGSTP
jgi:L-alanine-DL-glutamate epimerase-like enolase superfamily enzyme